MVPATVAHRGNSPFRRPYFAGELSSRKESASANTTHFRIVRKNTHKELRFPMLNLSPSARKELEAYFADKDRQTIRIFLAPGG